MSYLRFGLMIVTSTVVMFGLMYLNTYALEHVFFSETRAYMAVVMGAAMAAIMLAYMLGMYPSRAANLGIFAGAAVVFAAALWLVRSQVTVDGASYMRAMIPHHSIAIMTSERADIDDPRVRRLADEIIEAQRREIAEMRYLIAEVAGGRVAASAYEDPPPRPGMLEEALATVRLADLHPAPLPRSAAAEALPAPPDCGFRLTAESEPILWTTGDAAAMSLNGVVVGMEATDDEPGGMRAFATPGARVTLRPVTDEADWRGPAELVLVLEDGPTVGYRGFADCNG